MKNPVMQQQKEKSVPTIKACKGREVYLAVRLVYGYAGLDSKKQQMRIWPGTKRWENSDLW
jgi:hypothetical protein